MARKPALPLTPIKDLTPEQAAKRRLARKLGFRNEYRFDSWIRRMEALPESDPRFLHPDIKHTDFVRLNRIKRVDSKFRTPAHRLVEKKRILVDDGDTRNHMSSFAFLDRYLEQIQQLLRDPNTSDYRKRQLRKMQRDLQNAIKHSGDLGEARQLDLWGQYQGKDLGI